MSICGSYVQTIVLRHDAGMFTVKGINRLKILQDAIDRNLHPGQAAEMLGITPRHCRRLLKRYRQLGPLGMNNHSTVAGPSVNISKSGIILTGIRNCG